MSNKGPGSLTAGLMDPNLSDDKIQTLVNQYGSPAKARDTDKEKIEFALDLNKNPQPITTQKGINDSRQQLVRRIAVNLGIDAESARKNNAKL